MSRFLFCTACILTLIVLASVSVVADDAVRVRDPERDTVFVEQGTNRAAVVARMENDQIAPVAEQVADAIGTETQIIDEQDVLDLDEAVADRLQNRPLVLVGNALNNRAIYRLYIRELALCDADYPGASGWIIRTACDPWTAGSNTVIVGASNNKGLRRAADEFENALVHEDETVTLPWAWRFESGVDGDGDPLHERESHTEDDWSEYREKITYVD